jgi:hypothetical protein
MTENLIASARVFASMRIAEIGTGANSAAGSAAVSVPGPAHNDRIGA